MRNSAIVAFGTVALTLLVAIPGAYAVSRLEFFGRRQISGLFLAVYLFPSILLAVPLFVFFTRIGLRGSLVGLLIVYVSQIVAVSIYMLRNYFDTIPVSLEEAAAIDGASRLGIMRRISLPLALPAIMANALFVFMIAWNEFLFALLFLVEERDRWTVSLGLSQLAGSIEIPDDGPDGGVGDRDRPDHRDLLRQRAPADRGAHSRRGERLSGHRAVTYLPDMQSNGDGFDVVDEVGVDAALALVHEHGWQSWSPAATYAGDEHATTTGDRRRSRDALSHRDPAAIHRLPRRRRARRRSGQRRRRAVLRRARPAPVRAVDPH